MSQPAEIDATAAPSHRGPVLWFLDGFAIFFYALMLLFFGLLTHRSAGHEGFRLFMCAACAMNIAVTLGAARKKPPMMPRWLTALAILSNLCLALLGLIMLATVQERWLTAVGIVLLISATQGTWSARRCRRAAASAIHLPALPVVDPFRKEAEKLARKQKRLVELAGVMRAFGFASIAFIILAAIDRRGIQEDMALAAVVAAAGFFLMDRGIVSYSKQLLSAVPLVEFGIDKGEAMQIASGETSGDTAGSRWVDLVQEYHRAHAADIAALEDRFARAMVEKYGFQPAFVAQLLRQQTAGRNFTPATIWHRDKTSVENEARKLYEELAQHADDSRLFSRDIRTGEAVLEGHKQSALNRALFGAVRPSPARRVVFAAFFAIAGLCLYAVNFGALIPSAAWHGFGLAASVLLGLYTTLWLVEAQKSGKLPLASGMKPPGFLRGTAVFLTVSGCIWLAVVQGCGDLLTRATGSDAQQLVHFRKSASSRGRSGTCLKIEGAPFTRLCPEPEHSEKFPKNGSLEVMGRETWMGFSIMHYSFESVSGGN
jgi:hypothetical protein